MVSRLACIYCGRTTPASIHRCVHCDKAVVRVLASRFEQRRVLKTRGKGFSLLVWDRESHRNVFLRGLAKDAGAAEQRALMAEVHVLQNAVTPGLPKLVAVGKLRETNAIYTAQEWVAGKALGKVLASSAPRDQLALLIRALHVLWPLHEQGFVHAAIGPKAFKVTSSGQLMLLDFRLARPVGEPGGASGVRGYRAPEQAEPGPPLTPATDLFALAAVYYRALCKRYPYGNPEKFSRTLKQASCANPGVTEDMDELLAQALAVSPSERFPSSEAFAAALLDRTGLPTIVDGGTLPYPRSREIAVSVFEEIRLIGWRLTIAASVLWHCLNVYLDTFSKFTSAPRSVVASVTAAVLVIASAGLIVPTILTPKAPGTVPVDQTGYGSPQTSATALAQRPNTREFRIPPVVTGLSSSRTESETFRLAPVVPRPSRQPFVSGAVPLPDWYTPWASLPAYTSWEASDLPPEFPFDPDHAPAAPEPLIWLEPLELYGGTARLALLEPLAPSEKHPAPPPGEEDMAGVRFLTWPPARVYLNGNKLTEAPDRSWYPVPSGRNSFLFLSVSGVYQEEELYLAPGERRTISLVLEDNDDGGS